MPRIARSRRVGVRVRTKTRKNIEAVKATMAFENKKLPVYTVELGKKILADEITGDEARSLLAKKYNL